MYGTWRGKSCSAVDKNFEPHRYEMLCITHWRGKFVLASYEDTYYSVLIVLYNVRLSSLWFVPITCLTKQTILEHIWNCHNLVQ